MRFARNVHFQIKNGKEQEFAGLFEKDVLPMLRKQNGFLEEVTLVNPKGLTRKMTAALPGSSAAPSSFMKSSSTP